MTSVKRAILYGVLIWILALAVSMAAFPLRKVTPALFQSTMAVVATVLAVVFVNLYFRASATIKVREALTLGIIWLAMNLLLDLSMFSHGPMKMSLRDYLSEIGATYLIMPVVTAGLGFMLATTGRELNLGAPRRN